MPKVCLIVASLLAWATTAAAVEPNDSELRSEGLGVAKQFVATLQPELKAAMQGGGPVHAIRVCSDKAPAIAAELSASSGWTVKRVSLKPRNARSASPDAWERSQLQAFDRAAASGELPEPVSGWVDGRFRLMQAQPVQSICLTCHGTAIAPAVEQALETYYPGDTATGYGPGQVRGAISLTRRQ